MRPFAAVTTWAGSVAWTDSGTSAIRRIPALDSVDPSVGAELWDSETKLVERLLLAAAEQDKKGKAAAASPNGGTPASTERRKDV